MANSINRFCAIVRRHVFINFSLEKLLSADTVVTEAVLIIFSRIKPLDKFTHSSLNNDLKHVPKSEISEEITEFNT
jgi:hypothetical protein